MNNRLYSQHLVFIQDTISEVFKTDHVEIDYKNRRVVAFIVCGDESPCVGVSVSIRGLNESRSRQGCHSIFETVEEFQDELESRVVSQVEEAIRDGFSEVILHVDLESNQVKGA